MLPLSIQLWFDIFCSGALFVIWPNIKVKAVISSKTRIDINVISRGGGSTMKLFWYNDIHSQNWSLDCNVWLPNDRLEEHLSYLVLNTGTVHGIDCLLVNCLDIYVHIWRFISNIFIWWLNWRLRVTLTTQGPHDDIGSNFVIWGDFKSSFRQKRMPLSRHDILLVYSGITLLSWANQVFGWCDDSPCKCI